MKHSLAILALGSILLASCSTSTETKTDTTAAPAETVKNITLTDLGTHKSKESCWTAIRGDVYDITGAFGKHKGGDEALMKICGKDGTEIFTKQHGGQENPEKALASMPKMGKLQQ